MATMADPLSDCAVTPFPEVLVARTPSDEPDVPPTPTPLVEVPFTADPLLLTASSPIPAAHSA
jgi:hypothetical protein